MARRPLYTNFGSWWPEHSRIKVRPKTRIIRASIKQMPQAPIVPAQAQQFRVIIKIIIALFAVGVIGTIVIGYFFTSDGPFGKNPISGIADAISYGPLAPFFDMLPYIQGSSEIGQSYEQKTANFDGAYSCEATTTSPLGTVKTAGSFTCSDNRCFIVGERGFSGIIDSSGTFTGTNVVRADSKGNPIDTIPITGVFSSTSEFTLHGSGGGFTQVFICSKA